MNPILLLALLAVAVISIFSVTNVLKRWFTVGVVNTILFANMSMNNTFELFQMPLQVITLVLITTTGVLGYKAFATARA